VGRGCESKNLFRKIEQKSIDKNKKKPRAAVDLRAAGSDFNDVIGSLSAWPIAEADESSDICYKEREREKRKEKGER